MEDAMPTPSVSLNESSMAAERCISRRSHPEEVPMQGQNTTEQSAASTAPAKRPRKATLLRALAKRIVKQSTTDAVVDHALAVQARAFFEEVDSAEIAELDAKICETEERLIRTPCDLGGAARKLQVLATCSPEAEGAFTAETAMGWIVDDSVRNEDRLVASAFLDITAHMRKDDVVTAPPLASRAEAETAIAPPDADGSAWAAALALRDAARVRMDAAQQGYDAAHQAVDAACPAPPAEILKSKNGKPTADYFGSARELDLAMPTLPVAVRADLVAKIEAHQDARQAVYDHHKVSDLSDQLDLEANEESDLEEALLALPAPDTAAAAEKLRTFVRTNTDEDMADPDTAQRILTNGDYLQRNLLSLYRDLTRMAGVTTAAGAVEAWDAEAWVRAFEAHQGHYVNEHGRIEYIECEMPGYVGIYTFTLDDPDKIRAYREMRGIVASRGRDMTQPICVPDRDVFEKLYADDPMALKRWSDIFDAYERQEWMNFAGHPMAQALTGWQKEAIRTYAKSRPDRRAVARLVEHALAYLPVGDASEEQVAHALSQVAHSTDRDVEVHAAKLRVMDALRAEVEAPHHLTDAPVMAAAE
jgi:hypothetical protein